MPILTSGILVVNKYAHIKLIYVHILSTMNILRSYQSNSEAESIVLFAINTINYKCPVTWLLAQT